MQLKLHVAIKTHAESLMVVRVKKIEAATLPNCAKDSVRHHRRPSVAMRGALLQLFRARRRPLHRRLGAWHSLLLHRSNRL
jgi:hypothetical protein